MKADEKLMKIFTTNLNQLIEKKNMPQADIAKELGISRSRLNSWCRGKAIPNALALDGLAKYFNVSRTSFFQSEDQAKSSDSDLKLALFGTSDVSDELLDQVKAYAKFIMNQEANR